MQHDIRWPKNEHVTFHGRNGTGLCTGLWMTQVGAVLILRPVTSIDRLANCSIDLPVDKLSELIAALQRFQAACTCSSPVTTTTTAAARHPQRAIPRLPPVRLRRRRPRAPLEPGHPPRCVERRREGRRDVMSRLLPEGIILLPQEISLDHPNSRYRFQPSAAKPFSATPAALEKFGIETILTCLAYLQRQARLHHGLDYLQVFEHLPTKERLWFIEDDEGGAITALLPSDY